MPLNFITDSGGGRPVDSSDRNPLHGIPSANGGSAATFPRVAVDDRPDNLEPRVPPMLGPERRARQAPDFPSVEPAPTPSRRLDQSGMRDVEPRLLAADGAAEAKDAAK